MDSELCCGDYLELVSMRVEHDRPAINGVRCRDASRLLEGLSPICAWMPSTEEVLQAQVISRSPAESLVSTYGFLWRAIRAGNRVVAGSVVLPVALLQ